MATSPSSADSSRCGGDSAAATASCAGLARRAVAVALRHSNQTAGRTDRGAAMSPRSRSLLGCACRLAPNVIDEEWFENDRAYQKALFEASLYLRGTRTHQITPSALNVRLRKASAGVRGLVRILLEAGLSVETAELFQQSPVEYLRMTWELSPEVRSHWQQLAHEAARVGRVDVAKLLLELAIAESGFKVSDGRKDKGSDHEGDPFSDALFAAARAGQADAVRVVAAAGVDLDVQRPDEICDTTYPYPRTVTALMVAASHGHVAVAQALLESRAHVDHVARGTRSARLDALHFARASPEVVQLLREWGATSE